jgi:phage shock protein PspC (stress-responsive transcriptional regulator)
VEKGYIIKNKINSKSKILTKSQITNFKSQTGTSQNSKGKSQKLKYKVKNNKTRKGEETAREKLMKRLYRSRNERVFWGVCGGLAKYFNIDPVIILVLAVVSIFMSGLGILAYIIMAIVVPLEGEG